MSDFEEKLNAILSNPDAMAQVASLAQSLGYGLGTGIGFTAALCLVDEAKHQLKRCAVPSSFRGMPVLFLYLGLVSLAIYGLTGHPLPQ